MPAISTLQHCHFHILLIHFSNLFIAEFAKLFLVFLLHVFIIGHSSLSFIFAHELIHVINIDLLLVASELISRVNLHILIIVFLFFFLELLSRWFLLANYSARFLSNLSSIVTTTSSLGNKSVENDFHVINFKLARFLHKASESLDIRSIAIVLHKFAFVWMTLKFLWCAQEFPTATFEFISLS